MIDTLRNASGERLDATWTPASPGSHSGMPAPSALQPVVVVGHGVTSHKERPWQTGLCDALAEAGIPSLRFTFAGNPGSEGNFADATLSKAVADLGSVLDALDGRSVTYAGHSMGAAVGVLRAAEDPRIRNLVSLAGMVHVDAFMQRVFGYLQPGDLMLDKPHCPLSTALLDDAKSIGSVTDAAARIRIPWLLVHGTADELVPHQDALDAQQAADGRPELVSLDGVDHRFSDHNAAMANAVVNWLQSAIEHGA